MEAHLHRFKGKTVVVTGSSSGIGLATAHRFAAEGANVVLNGVTRDKLERAGEAFDADRKLIMCGDVSDKVFCAELVRESVVRFGSIDVLVNNAGTAVVGPFAESSDDEIDRVLSVNVRGALLLSREAYAHLKRGGGCIVNTASVSGLGGDFELAIYNASKGAVVNLTRALALEWGRDGVRVNAVAPSMVRTEMTAGMLENDALVDAFMRRLPLKRLGEPDDVAGAVAFLASKDAAWITGVNLPVDGGCSASNGQPDFRSWR